MATNPGILSEWPWQRLGNFKYLVLAPFVAHSLHSWMVKGDGERVLIFTLLMGRMLYNQLWISLSRFQTARSKHRIVNKSIDFEQVDREKNWDDQLIFQTLTIYLSNMFFPGSANMPIWRTDGSIMTVLLHAGPVEFLYYWFHRALHHHYLYSRYHSHHHASIVTEPITSVVHPFAEHIAYLLLFSIPLYITAYTRTTSSLQVTAYLFYVDTMNNLGHCNFEFIPKWLFDAFPGLKYLMYTPSFHSLHHTQFRTNYSLFMPFYDYIYGTMDKSSDDLYESSLRGREETTDMVHLTHPTTLQSIYHLRVGFASLASKPYAPKWYMLAMWPVTYLSTLMAWMYGSTFTVERNRLNKLKMQTWVIPRFNFQYALSWEREAINGLIEKAILDAEDRGVKVVTLGLLNQDAKINRNGELYIQKHPKLKLRIVDGSSLATAVVLKSIPKGTKQVLLSGNISKMTCSVTLELCRSGVQVMVLNKEALHTLKLKMPDMRKFLLLADNYNCKVWIVGEGLMDEEQRRAVEGTHIIPFSQFPPRKVRRDCVYYSTPAMMIPKAFENIHSCENWLGRRVMSAWRVAGIVHGLEGWDTHECGDTMLEIEKVWSAALYHGFRPLVPFK